MKDEITIQQMEMLLSEMRVCKSEHPKANVTYDTEKRRITISYPVPSDLWKTDGIKIDFK